MHQPLARQVPWVTGGGCGIGLAGAMELVKAGGHVVISGRTSTSNADALAKLLSLGRAEAVQLDVADSAAVQAVADDLVNRHGRIDIIVNSAGVNTPKCNFDVVTTAARDEVVNINLTGTFYEVRAVLPTMRAQGGGLISNVSSWAGLYASKLTGPTCNASKRAVTTRRITKARVLSSRSCRFTVSSKW